jgi:ubiquitin C-terminal hydrolase
MAVQVTTKAKEIFSLLTFYKIPTQNFQNFTGLVANVMEHLCSNQENNVIVAGDFNENLLVQRQHLIYDLFVEKNFKQLVTWPTTRYGSLLDHMYTNIPKRSKCTAVPTYFSDHDAVKLTIYDNEIDNSSLPQLTVPLDSERPPIPFLANPDNEVSITEPQLSDLAPSTRTRMRSATPQSKSQTTLVINRDKQNVADPDTTSGIPNFGNTCYINSLLQTLFSTHALQDLFEIGTNLSNILCQLKKKVKDSDSTSANNMHNLITMLQIINDTMPIGRQQDAHEYLLWILGKLHEEQMNKEYPNSIQHHGNWNSWQDYLNNHPTSVTKLLYSQFTIKSTCHVCKHTTTSCEYMPCVHVYLNSTDIILETSDHKTERSCVNQTCNERTTMCSSEMTHCPPILYIQLMRFDNQGHKINKRMKLPKQITMKNGTLYKLVAFINHHGVSINNGHYTAVLCNNNTWLKCNDECISKVRVTKTASDVYMLMYKKE